MISHGLIGIQKGRSEDFIFSGEMGVNIEGNAFSIYQESCCNIHYKPMSHMEKHYWGRPTDSNFAFRSSIESSISKIKKEANKMRMQALIEFNKNPYKPSSPWHYITSFTNKLFIVKFIQSQGLRVSHISCCFGEFRPSYILGFLSFILSIPLLILQIALALFLRLLFSWLPLCTTKHKITDLEKEWLNSKAKLNEHLCGLNIDKYILTELQKIANQLTHSNPNKPYYVKRGIIQWEEGGDENTPSHTETRETFEIRPGKDPNAATSL